MTATMRAVVLDAPGPPEALQIRELPLPEPRLGWVLIRVKAFGINRSELHTRLGLAQGVTFPRVLGIEATGVVVAAPGGEFEAAHQCGVCAQKCVPGLESGRIRQLAHREPAEQIGGAAFRMYLHLQSSSR